MRTKFILAAAAVSFLLPTSAGAQQNAPYDKWCREQGLDRGTVQVCFAYTYEQCMASRASHTERCYLNPRYDPRYRR